jgi:hypothetical protein
MILPPTPVPLPVATQTTAPHQNNLVNVAALAAQATARPVQAQTARAPRPVGRTDGTKREESASDVAHKSDTEAQVVRARTPGRGDSVDLSV